MIWGTDSDILYYSQYNRGHTLLHIKLDILKKLGKVKKKDLFTCWLFSNILKINLSGFN